MLNCRTLLLVTLAASVPALADEAPYTGQPYSGKAATIPGVIQAENYDIAPDAANGISFNYNGGPTKNALRTSGDSIGLAQFGNGHVSIKGEALDSDEVYAGWTHSGEWFKYSVHVAETGTYEVGGQFASAGTKSAISVSFSPNLTTGSLAIPTTAGYQPDVEVYHVWEKLDHLAEITLPKGDYVMTVKLENADGLNFDYLSFAPKK